jgi:hypothetical protein
MTRRPVVLSLLLISACAACSLHAPRPEGHRTTETRVVPPFERIAVGGAIDAKIRVGQPLRVALTTDAARLPNLAVRVRDGVLSIEQKGDLTGGDLTGGDRLEVELDTPMLKGLEVSGAADADVEGVHGERFTLEVSGASDVDVVGSVDVLEVEASGAADLDLGRLVARTLKLDASGASDVRAHATERADLDVSGASDVELSGTATVVRERTSGASSVTQAH